MKKIILGFAVLALALSSCKSDGVEADAPQVIYDAATQNKYDDQAAAKYLETHYFDARGNVKEFTATEVPSATMVKLSDLNPVTLASGVICIKRVTAQPTPGTTIGATDIVRILSNTISYRATEKEGLVAYTSPQSFRNGVSGTGIPEVDPGYYYTNEDAVKAGPVKTHSYYEMEGFGEALRQFKAFDISDGDNYNLQGIIIVPSRAAFGKDPHFNYSGFSLNDRSFVFNFQVYKTTARLKP